MAFKFEDKVVARIREAMESGNIPWVRPWDNSGLVPHNGISKREYNGLNFFLCAWLHPEDPRFFTKKQVLSLGGWIRYEEFKKFTPIVFWQPVRKPMTDEEGKPVLDANGNVKEKVIWITKDYMAWNFSQIDWNDKQPDPVAVKTRDVTPNAEIEAFLTVTGARILREANQTRAFYRPDAHEIHLPDAARFTDDVNFYATAFHELIHWTGHTTLLNRKNKNFFGSEDYAFEELVAEMGAAFLCARFGVDNTHYNQTAAYLDSWLKAINDQPSALQRAASTASKAVSFLLDKFDEPQKNNNCDEEFA